MSDSKELQPMIRITYKDKTFRLSIQNGYLSLKKLQKSFPDAIGLMYNIEGDVAIVDFADHDTDLMKVDSNICYEICFREGNEAFAVYLQII